MSESSWQAAFFALLSPITPLLSQGCALPAPPEGKLLTFPSGEGGPPPRAVAVRRAANLIFYSCRWQLYHNFMEEGPCVSERLVSLASFSCRSRPLRPSSVRAAPCQLPRRGSFFCPKGELFLFPADSCPNERDKWALVFLHKKLRNCEALYVVFTLLTNVLERDTIWAHQTRRSPKWKWQMHSFTAPVRRPARWRFLSFFWPVCGQTFCACCPLLSRSESGRGFIFRMKKRLRWAIAFL